MNGNQGFIVFKPIFRFVVETISRNGWIVGGKDYGKRLIQIFAYDPIVFFAL